MCGITGIISNQLIDKQALEQSVSVLKHRGPDGNGVFVSTNGCVGFGHSRLAFLDVSAEANQPLSTTNGHLTITFNGEIYNFLELRVELQSLGYKFVTRSDTEVLLTAYECWGTEMLSKLKGMFAFAIYDSINKHVFLARDRFGIKPLYYGVFGTSFVFGSEIKALFPFSDVKKKIRRQSVATFLANRYVPSPHTIWEGIFQLPAATSLYLNCETFEQEISQYWKLNIRNDLGNIQQTEKEIKNLILNSISQHLRSDVQVGSFLSGGMDSSLLVVGMKELNYDPIEAFSLGFDGWSDSEHFHARDVSVALGITLHEKLEGASSLDIVDNLMYFYDNPIADISIVPTFSISKLASLHVKAVLSGEGADECFAGYWWQKPERFLFKNKFQQYKAKFFGTSFEQIKGHYIQAASMGMFDSSELENAFTEEWKTAIPSDPFGHLDKFYKRGISTLKQVQFLDLNLFMTELVLAKIDRATMANSLEARVPFLDHELVEKLFSLDEKLYFDEKIQKKMIRSFLEKKVPSTVYNRNKQGFVGPNSFYENEATYREKLVDGRLVNDGVIKSSYIDKLLQTNDYWRLWKLYVLECWWRVWC